MADVKFTHAAPPALIEHCTRRVVAPSIAPSVGAIGSYDKGDVAALISWMTERDCFESHDEWVQCGMAIKAELGSDGLGVWQLTHDDTVTEDVEASKWNSFSTEPRPGSVTIRSLMARAHQMGWSGTIRKSASSMFDGVVAQLAANSGASLPGAMPLLDTQRIVASQGQTVLDNFLDVTAATAARPVNDTFARLPDSLREHPLFEAMSSAIERVVAMAEGGSKTFRQDRVLPTLAVLHAIHPHTCEGVVQRITALGGVMSPGKLDSAVKKFEREVRIEQNTATGFITDSKGLPASDNSDNVRVFIRQRGIDLRFNVWSDTVEVKDGSSNFTPLTDYIFGDLLMDAKSSQFNYHPAETLFRRGLISNARGNLYDPLNERLDDLAAKWDGVPRLATWLSAACGVPCDVYHQSVGRNLIGGMVKRARYPGCKHDETVIFISPEQGTGKSTMCEILALSSDWFTDSFKFGASQQNSVPQLAGKWVVELGELAGMNKTEVEDIKNFLASKEDNYVKKYEAFATQQKRRVVFIGTSNARQPLVDPSGNRRFLPVHINGEVNLDWLRANVEQIVGEAARRETQGEEFAIPRSVWDEARRHQEAARKMTPTEELCYEWFDRPEAEYGFYIVTGELRHAFKLAGQNQNYSPFMDKLGWRSENLVVPETGRKQRVWVRHSNNRLDQCARLQPMQQSPTAPVTMRLSMQNTPAVVVPPLPPAR